MGKGKGKTYDKEYSLLQKTRHENQKLKRENARLRNRLARINENQFSDLADLMEKSEIEDMKIETSGSKHGWECHDCKEGYLEINMYAKMGEIWYFRECNECGKRTKSQKHHEGVQGVVKRSAEKDSKK